MRNPPCSPDEPEAVQARTDDRADEFHSLRAIIQTPAGAKRTPLLWMRLSQLLLLAAIVAAALSLAQRFGGSR